MIHHRKEQDVEPLYHLAFGKRPREELYHLAEDPHYMRNVASDPGYEHARKELEARLMGILRQQQDPRLVEDPVRYESEPYAGKPVYVKLMDPDGKDTWPQQYAKARAMMIDPRTLGSFGGSIQFQQPSEEAKATDTLANERGKKRRDYQTGKLLTE